MPNFKLECEHRNPWDESLDVRNTTEFNYVSLSDILPAFEDFLRGCGFVFEGHLDFVQDEEETTGCENNCEGCECGTNEKSAEWNWTVNQLMKGPITLEDVTKEDKDVFVSPGSFTVNLADVGAAAPTITVGGGVDTITITGLSSDKCELCGLPKSVMKAHNCWDDNCPKESW